MSVAKKDYKKVTTKSLIDMKANGEKISMLTCYDYSMAKVLEAGGVDVMLVGDSASNVMAGHETTLPITLDQMIYHAQSVVRGADRALIVVDLPFGSYQSDPKEVSEQRKYAERILELGWNSEDAITQKAMQLYIDFATKQGETEKVELLKMQLEVLKAMPKIGDSSKVNKLIKKKQFGFALNGKVEPMNGFDLDWIHTYLGYPIDESSNLEDCALGDYEGNSFFNSAEFITHDLDHTYKARKMDMLNKNGFILDNHLLEQYTTETMFLKLAKGLITTIDPVEHTYYIAVEDVLYSFEFRNNELLRIELIYYC